MYLDFEDIIKLCLSAAISILFLQVYLPIIIELHFKEQVIGRLYLQVIAWANRMQKSIEAFFVFDWSSSFLSESDDVLTFFGQD